MLFSAPQPFSQAIAYLSGKGLLPTSGATADLRQLSAEVRRRALFSATVDDAKHLQELADLEAKLVRGEINQATARAEMKLWLAETGYQPDESKRGGLQDLSSSDRINLQLETNLQSAQGYGHFLQGQNTTVLDMWPAQELVRVRATAKQRNWLDRWQEAGGDLYDGRMIALKDDDVWDQIGSSALFDDGLDNPWPPFAFNSGMGVRDVKRREAMRLGLIDRDTQVEPQNLDLGLGLKSDCSDLSEELRDLVAGQLQGIAEFAADGVLHFLLGGGA